MYHCHCTTSRLIILVITILLASSLAMAQQDGEYGDAPEGVLAYPATGVIGMFPTCVGVGPAGFAYHAPWPYQFFGPLKDFEMDGNAGLCPGFVPYDLDECFMDGDAGLIFPGSFTISAGSIVACAGSPGGTMGPICAPGLWGATADIHVVNSHPQTAYLNVLMDWNQDGVWAPSVQGACSAPEYVLIDFPIPGGFVGPLSGLAPPGFMLGGDPGYVWVRFNINPFPIGDPNWDGSGMFEDGESEDYLLLVDVPVGSQETNWDCLKSFYR